MSTAQTWRTRSTSLNDTLALGEEIGSRIRGGELIELVSDLGGGKTAFVRGLAKGMGSNDTVHSPSFTISNQYQARDLTLYHFDFYRLAEAGIVRNEIKEVINSAEAVVVVEWGNVIDDVLPDDRLTIKIMAVDENQRDIECAFPDKLSYFFPDNT